MSKSDSPSALNPTAYRPYANPREYILNWTDEIWIKRALGRIHDHYAADIKVHTAYGETYDLDHVIQNSVQKMSAFPNGGGGSGEDVVWEQRGAEGFISSHRVLKTGTHTGYWSYGPPTGRDWISRTIAHCLVKDGKVIEEWLVRDEFAVLQSLGLDPYAIAAEMAKASPVTGESVDIASSAAFSGKYEDAFSKGVSGNRPSEFRKEYDAFVKMFEQVWNQHRFDLAGELCDPNVVCHSVRMRRYQGLDSYQQAIIDLLAVFPDGKIEIRDFVVCDSTELGQRIAVVWVLTGHYKGVPAYGPVTGKPVKVLGISHYEMRGGKILREWRVYDEIAILAQIMAEPEKEA